MNMSELKKQMQEALPEGLIVNEEVLEQIVGGVKTNMDQKDLDMLLEKAGLPSMDIALFIAKPKPGPGGPGTEAVKTTKK